MKPWKKLTRRVLLDLRPRMRLEEHHLKLPDGREVPDWLWVDTPDFVNVVAVTPEGKHVCFRQQKYAVPDTFPLGIAGGYVEEGENPSDAAVRELKEETGYVSDDWTPLGDFAVDGNRGCGRAHLFLAENCRKVAEPASDDLEDQEILLLEAAEVRAALLGELGVLSWTAAAALALLRLEEV